MHKYEDIENELKIQVKKMPQENWNDNFTESQMPDLPQTVL